VLFVLILLLIIYNVVVIATNGSPTITPDISNEAKTIGSGEELNYVVLGDSTAVAQGAQYSDGYAVNTAENLAENYKVTYINYGVSGARISDVVNKQLSESKDFTPDLVLVGVGANDVTHLTSLGSVENDIYKIMKDLKNRNNNVRIVFTGAASMGDVLRFPQPIKYLAGKQTERMNNVFKAAANEENVFFAAIAEKTGDAFASNPEYFASDKFHPSAAGYAEWTKALSPVLEEALN
jgi:lysophospholipase L1-like esterase